jgi:hypothetical protein
MIKHDKDKYDDLIDLIHLLKESKVINEIKDLYLLDSGGFKNILLIKQLNYS